MLHSKPVLPVLQSSGLRRTLVALFTGAALCTFVGLMGCQKKDTVSTAPTEILIGQFGSLTGATATFGQSTDMGIRMAFDSINAAGGVLGRQLKLITEDDQGKP